MFESASCSMSLLIWISSVFYLWSVGVHPPGFCPILSPTSKEDACAAGSWNIWDIYGVDWAFLAAVERSRFWYLFLSSYDLQNVVAIISSSIFLVFVGLRIFFFKSLYCCLLVFLGFSQGFSRSSVFSVPHLHLGHALLTILFWCSPQIGT